MALTYGDIDRYCLSLPGAALTYPFDFETPVFKVGGKMFALYGITNDPPQLNLKCDPDDAEALRSQYPAIRPGFHMNKKHWNTIVLDGSLSDALVRELIDHSYALVVASLPRRVREDISPKKSGKAK
ncbi:MAG: MmcQ/YjbR family DNA-binding protein [Anaerolineae bacterium]|nr:MAG: MmcQ/YjbR family DNA-binding protein [Anaerolineae bacterium]